MLVDLAATLQPDFFSSLFLLLSINDGVFTRIFVLKIFCSA